MPMERHRCKLCSKIFNNGRALGGHMRSHLASLPIPPRKRTQHSQLGESTQSDSSSTRSDDHELVGTKDEKFNSYGLRENPKRSNKASDPEFLDAGSVVQDRESETESTQTPTRKRSKRVGQSQKLYDHPSSQHEIESKKMKSESATESTPVSSVSNPDHQDEEVAICLMMLSRDVWDNSVDSSELVMTRGGGTRFKCVTCKKVFKTSKALKGHKTSNKECQQDQITTIINNNNNNNKKNGDQDVVKIYECPFCYKVFGSGQALGGHKRSHLLGSSTNNNTTSTNVVGSNNNNNNNNANNEMKSDHYHASTSFVLDLNLPAPVDDDEDHSHIGFH